MDPAPRGYDELPLDAELRVPVPFACGTEVPQARDLDVRRVTQCALSRVCGVCGSSLGRPIAFLGSQLESDRNAFHFPPSHVECAERLRHDYADVRVPVLGQDEAVRLVLVTTAGFDYVRPSREDADRRATFAPNSRLGG